MRDTGKKIYSMAMVKNYGLTIPVMKENIMKGKNKEKGYMCGVMAVSTMGIGKTTE